MSVWLLSAKIVLSNRLNLAVASCAAIVFWIIFNAFDGILLFSPLTFYYPIPLDAMPNFLLSSITAPLVGIIISMNTYIYKHSHKIASKSLFSSSTLGTVSSMCVSCSSVGFYLSSIFGSTGVAASTFLSSYQIPLRILAIFVLIWAYYSAHRSITRSCYVNLRRN